MHQRTEAMTFDEAFDEKGTHRPHYADLIAALEGCALEDNDRTPSGMAYALIARQAIARHLPYDGRWRNIAAEMATYLRMVVAASKPEPEEDGIAILLTDGPSNSAWYEHQELAELGELRLTRV